MTTRRSTNYVILVGELEQVQARPAGREARLLYEIRLRVARPGRDRGATMLLPALTWDADLAAGLLALAPGAALVLIGHLAPRWWPPPTGGPMRLSNELLIDSVAVDLADGWREAEPVRADRPEKETS
jgi:hypothetical protein